MEEREGNTARFSSVRGASAVGKRRRKRRPHIYIVGSFSTAATASRTPGSSSGMHGREKKKKTCDMTTNEAHPPHGTPSIPSHKAMSARSPQTHDGPSHPPVLLQNIRSPRLRRSVRSRPHAATPAVVCRRSPRPCGPATPTYSGGSGPSLGPVLTDLAPESLLPLLLLLGRRRRPSKRRRIRSRSTSRSLRFPFRRRRRRRRRLRGGGGVKKRTRVALRAKPSRVEPTRGRCAFEGCGRCCSRLQLLL